MMQWNSRSRAGVKILAGMGVMLFGNVLTAGTPECRSGEVSTCSTHEAVTAERVSHSEVDNILAKYQEAYPEYRVLGDTFAVRSNIPVEQFGDRLTVDKRGGLSIIRTHSDDSRDALFNSADVDFIAPAFQKSDATVIMGDSVVLFMNDQYDRDYVESLVKPLGFEIRTDAQSRVWEVITNASSGLDLIDGLNKLKELEQVEIAQIDTFQQTGRMNYTGEYGSKDFGGTSGAVALVAGTAAMVRDMNPELDAWQVYDIMREEANPGFGGRVETSPLSFIGNGSWGDILTTVTVSNGDGSFTRYEREVQYSPEFGDGIVNPFDAVSSASSYPGSRSAEMFGRSVPNLADDPLSDLQWYMFNSQYDQITNSLSNLRIDNLWNSGVYIPDANDTDVRLVIIDDGVATDHPELNVVRQFDTSNSGFLGSTIAQHRSGTGHGTAVAGILAARDNNIGIVGMLPGYPITSVKVSATDGDRGNQHFVTRAFDVFTGLDFVLSEAQNNPDNEYVVAVTTAGVPFYFGLAVSIDTSILAGIARTLAFNNVVTVFPAGNGNEDITEYFSYFRIGPQEQVELQEGELRDIQSALIVSAVHNAPFRGEAGQSSKATYSNFGNQVSLAAPSGDDTYNIFFPLEDRPFIPVRKLRMASTDINLLSLGGNDIREYDFPGGIFSEFTSEMPSGGVVGVANWPTVFGTLFTSDENLAQNDAYEFVRQGIFFNTESGTLEIYPQVIQDENGIFSGPARVVTRDSNNVVTSERTLTCNGQFYIQRFGTRRDNEYVFSFFFLQGFDSAGNYFFTFGNEGFSIIDGELFAGSGSTAAKIAPAQNKIGIPVDPDDDGGFIPVLPPDVQGYTVFAFAAIQGAGTYSTTGRLFRSDINGTEESGFSGEDSSGDFTFDYALGSFYSPNISTTFQYSDFFQINQGTASLDSDFDFIRGPANSIYNQTIYSTPPGRGNYFAFGYAGNYFAQSSGFHTAANDQLFLDLVDATSYANFMMMSTPGAFNLIFEDDLPNFVFVD